MAYRGQVTDSGYSGIFAFEGDWNSADLEEGWSIRPTLETLRDMFGIKFIHRQIGTPGELRYYVDKWLTEGEKNYRDYTVGYFRFHGNPGLIYPNADDGVTLSELEEWIDGRAEGRVIVFHSCSTLKITEQRITEFLDHTKASAVVGYAEDVDSLEAISFELLALWALTGHKPDHARELLHGDYGEFAKRLGLKFRPALSPEDADG